MDVAYKMTIEVQEVHDVPDHRGWLCSLLNSSINNKVPPESSRLLDVVETRREVWPFFRM